MRTKCLMTYSTISILLFAAILSFEDTLAQTKEGIKQQAESQLGKMTPDQIEAKIRQAGFTRAQAEAKAKEYGIDLETYLNRLPASAAAPSKDTTQPPRNRSCKSFRTQLLPRRKRQVRRRSSTRPSSLVRADCIILATTCSEIHLPHSSPQLAPLTPSTW